jgi:ABC-type branched-subunit amino acid transport system substrate-binding protein
MTGNLQAFGQEQNWTLNYAVDYVNSLGGIPLSNGQHAMIRLVVLDDQSDPSHAVTNLNSLISTYNAKLILGELGGVQDSVAQSFASKNQIPYVGPVYISQYKSCSSNCSNSWIFAPFQNETNEAHTFMNWFKTEDPSTASHNVTIAFFGEGDPAAQFNNAAGEAYAKLLGYTVCSCSDTTFTPGSQSEMTTFITAAKQAGADAIYGLPLPNDAVLMLQTAKASGYTPKAWLLTRGTAVAPFAISSIGGLGNVSQGVMSSFPWAPNVPYVGNILGHNVSNGQIVGDYLKVWGHPPTLEGVYYTEVLVAVDAIQQAGSLVNTAVRQALLTHTYQTQMGNVTFTAGGQWKESWYYNMLMQWHNVVIGGGAVQALEILEPTAVSTTNVLIYPFTYQSADNSTVQTTQPWPPAATTTS